MFKILSELCTTKRLASIYTNYNEMSKFRFGFVLAVNEKEIAIQMVTPDGEYDGISVIDVGNVIRVETDGQYAEKMKKLCSEDAVEPRALPVTNDDILRSVLQLAFREKQIISLELLDSGYNDVVGFAAAIDENVCTIRLVDEYGYADGVSYVPIQNITKVSLSTEDEKRIMRLWTRNQASAQNV